MIFGMEHNELIRLLDNREFLNKLYGFAYVRCSSSHEAEDLCSDILVSIISSVRKNPEIRDINAFIWTIAHRVYADYCRLRTKEKDVRVTESYSDTAYTVPNDPINDLLENEDEKYHLKRILHEIAFLSKIYRDVMVMYYLDGIKTSEIAARLNISETTVKQRLFHARSKIRKEVEKMSVSYTLKPIDIKFIGTGNPLGNDPRTTAERVLSKNLLYLCRNTALSIEQISEQLNVPVPYIEDETEILCRGANGTYGLLRRLDNGKYISNFILLNASEYNRATAVYKNILDEFCSRLSGYINDNRDRIMSFPFLNKQDDIRFITWSLIYRMAWCLDGAVNERLKKTLGGKGFVEREFSTVGLAVRQNESAFMGFYGCDDTTAENLCGYSLISFCNIYGPRIQKHFHCGHNISTDPQLMLVVRAVEGIDINTLSENDKEIAAKAIENGYIKKDGNRLVPKIPVIDGRDVESFYRLSHDFRHRVEDLGIKVADNLLEIIREVIPEHLINEYPLFCMLIFSPVIHYTIEKCIKNGVLTMPETTPCAEGTWMIVAK